MNTVGGGSVNISTKNLMLAVLFSARHLDYATRAAGIHTMFFLGRRTPGHNRCPLGGSAHEIPECFSGSEDAVVSSEWVKSHPRK